MKGSHWERKEKDPAEKGKKRKIFHWERKKRKGSPGKGKKRKGSHWERKEKERIPLGKKRKGTDPTWKG
jgi:hypothetical protein